jgi:hypothetical protein
MTCEGADWVSRCCYACTQLQGVSEGLPAASALAE